MKRILIAFALLAVLLSCTKKNNQTVKPLIVAMELQFPPFETADSNGKPSGISVEIAKGLAKFLNRPLEIRNTSWTGLIPSLQTGKVDLVLSSMTITKKRAEVVDFSNPYAKAGLTLLLNKNSQANNFQELNNKKFTIAVKSGTSGAILAKEKLKNANVRVFDDVAACVLEVSQGKADAFIYDALTVFENHKRHLETTKINLNPIQGTNLPWGIAVKKGNKQLLTKINQFIDKSQKDGEFKKIAKVYLTGIMTTFQKNKIPSFFDVK